MNKTSLAVVFPLAMLCSGLAYGQYNQSIYAATFVNQAVETPEIKELYNDGFNVTDVNNDGFVSENEFSYLVQSIDSDTTLNADEKQNKKADLEKAFATFDSNKDNRLSKDEFLKFQIAETQTQAQQKANFLSETHNKVLNAADPSAEAQKQLDKVLKQLKEANEALSNISPEEFANNLINNTMDAIAQENYFQMDKNKDNCVKPDEFIEYMRVYQKNQMNNAPEEPLDEKFLMSDEELAMWYEDIDKKQKDCLTQEEYIKDFSTTADFVAEK